MLTAMIKNRSLTFYQPTKVKSSFYNSQAYVGGLSAAAVSSSLHTTVTTTSLFNNQLNKYLSILRSERDKISKKVADSLANDPSYKGARSDGVKLAWQYEKADVEMGGTGSADWNTEQQQEIKNTGKVRGSEGHHQKNVAAHPQEQGNPDNIKFFKTRQDHLQKGHKGDFNNETDGPLIDKDKMLKCTNRKRVFKNEMKGLAIVALIGTGFGFLIGFSVSLAQTGITPDTIKYAFNEGVKTGASTGMQSIIGYGIGRIGQVATSALQGMLNNAGFVITDNIAKMCNLAVVGTITIMVFSLWQLYKTIDNGIPVKEAVIRVGKQALFSLSLLAVSIAAQGIWGGIAGIVVSTSIGFVFITNVLIDIRQQRIFSEKIRAYMIDKSKPAYV